MLIVQIGTFFIYKTLQIKLTELNKAAVENVQLQCWKILQVLYTSQMMYSYSEANWYLNGFAEPLGVPGVKMHLWGIL